MYTEINEVKVLRVTHVLYVPEISGLKILRHKGDRVTQIR
jgi:hypothetical protein